MRGKLDLYCEKVAPSGSVIAPGVMKVLGKPDLDPLAVLMREAVQNSWDARVDPEGAVTFDIAGWTLNTDQRNTLRDCVFASCPDVSLPWLSKHLRSSNPFHVLAVRDGGTSGLGGPTRADVIAGECEASDFVDFLRNVGQPPDKRLAGGTFGYGKAAFYQASKGHTICVYTRCVYRGKYETRFLAAALGEPFQASGARYTGRHWWGRIERSLAEPILDANADALAQGLGIPMFGARETGTTVLVLQPAFNPEHKGRASSQNGTQERTPQQAVNLMVEQILFNFWPKMLSYGSTQPAIQFTASWNGRPIAVPTADEFPPVAGFAAAMYRLKGQEPLRAAPFRNQTKEIRAQRPAKLLGRLSLQQYQVEPFEPLDTGEQQNVFADITHHTALMRQPELIVKYLRGEPFPVAGWGCAGVFITDADVDSVFANAEPPTHDDWVAKGLEDSWHRRYINVALREIEREMAEFATPPQINPPDSELLALSAFADRLGQSLLPVHVGPSAAVQSFGGSLQGLHDKGGGLSGTGNSTGELEKETKETGFAGTAQDSSGPNAQSRSRVQVTGEEFVVMNDQAAVKVHFVVHHAKGVRATTIRAQASVVIDGTQVEGEPPIDADMPHVLLWKSPQGNEELAQDSVVVPSNGAGEWTVIVSLPKDLMTDIDLKAESSK